MSYQLHTFRLSFSTGKVRKPGHGYIEWRGGADDYTMNVIRRVYRALRKAGYYDYQARLYVVELLRHDGKVQPYIEMKEETE